MNITFIIFLSDECSRACNRMYLPVCGSDGNTYNNECLMLEESCIQRVIITVAHEGPCVTNVKGRYEVEVRSFSPATVDFQSTLV